ncbi:MAG: FHA domain-containing protein [Lachnospiraceae bacterium]|nr:FHA domain-containing protein [Lachnospiraceae bacterium]
MCLLAEDIVSRLMKCSHRRMEVQDMDSESKRFTVTRSLAMNKDKRGAIVGLKGFLAGKIIHLNSDSLSLVGRDPAQCDVVIKGDSVSRVHFHIRYNSATEDYTIKDCSKNGVVIDGKYKLKPNVDIKVNSGNKIWVGNSDNELILG